MTFYVYIMRCCDGTFYTGYTKDLQERARLHSSGRGARYTKSHPPKELVYSEEFPTRSTAMKREKSIKKLSHEQKTNLVNARNSSKQAT